MIAFYLMRLAVEKMTLEEVPQKWHDEVAAKLKEA